MKKVSFFVLSLSVLTNCGELPVCHEGNADFVVNGNIPVCLNDTQVDAAEIEAMIDLVQQEVQNRYPSVSDVRERLNEVVVSLSFTSQTLVGDCVDVGDGVERCRTVSDGSHSPTIGQGEVFVTFNAEEQYCIAMTSLAHELLHSVDALYFDRTDGNHDTDGLYDRGGQDSVEYVVRAQAMEALASCQ